MTIFIICPQVTVIQIEMLALALTSQLQLHRKQNIYTHTIVGVFRLGNA